MEFQYLMQIIFIAFFQVFSSMTAEKASEKSIRLTALDANGEVKIFLVMVNNLWYNKKYFH